MRLSAPSEGVNALEMGRPRTEHPGGHQKPDRRQRAWAQASPYRIRVEGLSPCQVPLALRLLPPSVYPGFSANCRFHDDEPRPVTTMIAQRISYNAKRIREKNLGQNGKAQFRRESGPIRWTFIYLTSILRAFHGHERPGKFLHSDVREVSTKRHQAWAQRASLNVSWAGKKNFGGGGKNGTTKNGLRSFGGAWGERVEGEGNDDIFQALGQD